MKPVGNLAPEKSAREYHHNIRLAFKERRNLFRENENDAFSTQDA